MPISSYDEKRNFKRMGADHPLQFRKEGSNETYHGICCNLSATGIMFTTENEITDGTELEINMTPQYSVVSPFEATVEVIRAQQNGAPGIYVIAGKITSIK
ncbi:MAG: PilZ domain-containing protein [Ectothiorhodospiraceae bacterium]|nr:PilZ domain-containing protein [Ectothiorhodospiraceae bacterium]